MSAVRHTNNSHGGGVRLALVWPPHTTCPPRPRCDRDEPSEAEVQRIAAKSTAYETGVLAGRQAGLDRAAVLVVGGWVDARDRVNSMADALADQWSIEKRLFSDGKDRERNN